MLGITKAATGKVNIRMMPTRPPVNRLIRKERFLYIAVKNVDLNCLFVPSDSSFEDMPIENPHRQPKNVADNIVIAISIYV